MVSMIDNLKVYNETSPQYVFNPWAWFYNSTKIYDNSSVHSCLPWMTLLAPKCQIYLSLLRMISWDEAASLERSWGGAYCCQIKVVTSGQTPSLHKKYTGFFLHALHNIQDQWLFVPSEGRAKLLGALLKEHKCQDWGSNTHSAG